MPTRDFILKVSSVCNLNCSYCYMYNMGDTTFKGKPRAMDMKIAKKSVERIFEYAKQNELNFISLSLHGGEPLLVGKDWISQFMHEIKKLAPENLRVQISLQTNGTLLDEDWISLLKSYGISLGISFDGPPEWHNRYRVDFSGRGSYQKVRNAVDLVIEKGIEAPNWGVLVVANPNYSGVDIYKHLIDIGVSNMDFLWPDYHHDNIPPWPPGALAEFYKNIFDKWFQAADPNITIRWFEIAIGLILGINRKIDSLGPNSLEMAVVETDGSLEPLDVLRTCENGMAQVGLNVMNDSISDLYKTELFKECCDNQSLLPTVCKSCSAYKVCGGGYMPHRWGKGRRFENNSVHCNDIFSVLRHIAMRLNQNLKGREHLLKVKIS